ncbi:MAG TPA: Dabb family protein [Gemmataceae bacterium]|nr:Dabb family protein [Gemmataceae bacterium]
MKKIRIAATLIVIAWLAISQLDRGAVQGQQPPKAAPAPYAHSVILYLKKDTPPAKVEELIADCHKTLGKIPSVRGLWVGRRAEKTSASFADKDFSVGLVLLFDNYDGLKAYEVDATHQKLVQTYMPFIEKIVVYDFENQMK